MAVNGSAVATVGPTSAVDPVVAAAMRLKERMETVKSVLAPDLTDAELQLFAMVAERTGLDPFARHIYAIKRAGRMTIQTGIDGFRSVADRTGEYRGSDEPEYGPMVGGHPEWARVVVHREKANGTWVHQAKKVWWDEYYPGPNQGQWGRMPRNQLAKCAEAGAFRMAFPQQLGQVYVAEEMDQADAERQAAEQATPVQAPSHRDAIRAQAAALAPTTSAAPGTGTVADTRPVQAEASGVPGSATAAAESSPVPAPPAAGEDDAVEGEAVEVTGMNPGELRDWLRGRKVSITEARDRARDLYSITELDLLDDAQRGALAADLERNPPR